MATQSGAYASPESVQSVWREMSPEETARAQALLDQASRMVRRRWPATDARIASGELTPEDVADVVVSMAKAALAGPEVGVESETNSTGPFSSTRKYSNPLGDLYFAKWMVEMLDPPRRIVRHGWLS